MGSGIAFCELSSSSKMKSCSSAPASHAKTESTVRHLASTTDRNPSPALVASPGLAATCLRAGAATMQLGLEPEAGPPQVLGDSALLRPQLAAPPAADEAGSPT